MSTVVVRILALRNNNETLLIKKVVNLSIEKVIIIRFYLGIFLKIGWQGSEYAIGPRSIWIKQLYAKKFL